MLLPQGSAAVLVPFSLIQSAGLPSAPWICTLHYQDEQDATGEPAPKDETTKGDAGKKAPWRFCSSPAPEACMARASPRVGFEAK